MNALASESYSTRYRDLAAGLIFGGTRISGAFAPFLMYKLFSWDKRMPMLLLAILDFIAIGTMYHYPKDLT